jgi:flagellar basal body-associated protein FliL
MWTTADCRSAALERMLDLLGVRPASTFIPCLRFCAMSDTCLWKLLFLPFLIALAPLLAGCGESGSQASEMEAMELLDMLEDQQMTHDPRTQIEVDLGRFRVTHANPGADGQLFVQFHLFGILPEARAAKLEEVRPHFENRLRDAIISLIQHSDVEQLSDPSMAFFRAELVGTINRVLQDRLVKDVAFSELSISTYAVPWANDPGKEKEKKSGGHGGGHGH